MARVITPVHPRRYNPNPKGSATTTVLMKAHNPFETPVRQVTRRSGSLPGMGAIDLAPLQSAGQEALKTTATSGGIDWASIWGGAIKTGTELVGQAGSNLIDKLIPPASVKLPVPQAHLLPGQPGASAPVYIQPPSRPSPLPWIIGGGVLLGAVVFMMRKRR